MEQTHRLRRLRRTKQLRMMVQETRIPVESLIYPLFIVPEKNIKNEIASLPGNYHLSLDRLEEEIEAISYLNIGGIILFGIPETKDETGSEAYNERGIIQRAIEKIKNLNKEIVVVTDVCLCEYTNHGHCGVIKNGEVDNDLSVELIAKAALSHAKAGADIIAPSDMMDGRVKAIRGLLDKEGLEMIPIMSYSAKYASAFYAPFREAAQSTPQFGDRKSYQMDPANGDEAMREIELDICEGADIVMIKPALAYLDIIRRAKEKFNVPIAAFNVSGEYAMVKAAAKMGWMDEEKIMVEMLTGIRRAGASIIITYFAKEYAGMVKAKGG